ncbi:DNA-binding protein [Caballeronia terrestris]|jgi:transcriptional regulator with XRE-family HTH domain|uniref:DNA-binding protein n=1 Tax=Caballeronia terrestris TaxID=1226301 RepID=A0A158JCS5_9BURK|nr:helix-turn-helix transcriptional regulator [Caballeronia terrestris]SAL66495.1 DNA-binding protein [Caballeronia terrestris]
MSTLVRHFGATVRELRESQGWTQEQLAEHAGLNRSYVGEIERGTCIASIVTLDKLAKALDVTMARLLASSRPGACGLAAEAQKSET